MSRRVAVSNPPPIAGFFYALPIGVALWALILLPFV